MAITSMSSDIWFPWATSTGDTTTNGNESTIWETWDSTTDTTATVTWSRWMPTLTDTPPRVPPRPRIDVITPEAEKRADQLLKQHLDDIQRAQYERERKFVVRVAGVDYEFDCSRRQHNIFQLSGGKRVREFCIYQRGRLPAADNHLAQKLLLEADPDEFKRIANAMALN